MMSFKKGMILLKGYYGKYVLLHIMCDQGNAN